MNLSDFLSELCPDLSNTYGIIREYKEKECIFMTEILKVPFNRSYWVVPGKLLAGCYLGSENSIEEEKNLKRLIQVGIRHVISLLEPQEYSRPDDPFPLYVDHMESIAERLKISVTFDQISMVASPIWLFSCPAAKPNVPGLGGGFDWWR